MELNKATKTSLPPKKVIIFIVSVVLLGLAIWGGTSYVNNRLLEAEEFEASETEMSTEANKKTAFDGVNVNEEDPDAIAAYCEGAKSFVGIKKGSAIVDTCVSDAVANKWLKMMTTEQIEVMSNERPECFSTGYDAEGYHCWTGYNAEGCNKDNLREDGSRCDNEGVVEEFDNMIAFDSAKICSMIESCNELEFENGFNKFGCDRQGRRRDGTICPWEQVTRLFNEETGRDQFGFGKDGFNEHNCDMRGYNRDGEKCPIDKITRVYGFDGKDQLGFFEDGFNDAGCDINGGGRDGKLCARKDITRIFVPETGLDQFGLDEDGYSGKTGCNLQGYNRQGELCAFEDIPRIVGKDGKDQLGLFSNGRNEFNCNLAGKKASGAVCSASEVVLGAVSPVDGKNSLGLFANGLNEHDCGLDGFNPQGELCPIEKMPRIFDSVTKLDQFGFTEAGYNEHGCSMMGFRSDGTFCDSHEITRIFNPDTGLDQFGFTESGYNSKGCDINGMREDGTMCDLKDITRIYDPVTGLDQFGIGKDGYNKWGCDINGLDKQGNICPIDKITRIYDPKTGLDQFGIGKNGFNSKGCSLEGLRKDGGKCPVEDVPVIVGKNGFSQLGLDSEFRNIHGCDPSGVKRDGRKCSIEEMLTDIDPQGFNARHRDTSGKNRLGFFDNGLNEHGCDINGRALSGELCDFDKVTRVFDKDNRDQFGFDPSGFNIHGCNIKGEDAQGNRCPEDKITRIYGADGIDQFGNSLEEVAELIAQEKRAVLGLSEALKKSAKVSKDAAALNALFDTLTPEQKASLGLDAEGYNSKGCSMSGLRRDGSRCSLEDTPRIIDPDTGLDQFGLDDEGYNTFGCSLEGKRRDGSQCSPEEITRIYGKDGKDQFGNTRNEVAELIASAIKNQTPRDKSISRVNKAKSVAKNAKDLEALFDSLTEAQKQALGLDSEGFNEKGCSLAGLRRDGSRCSLEDTPRLIDPVTGLDQFGLDDKGYNAFGCSLEGKRRDGSECSPEEITRIYTNDGIDQFGVTKDELMSALSSSVTTMTPKAKKLLDSLSLEQKSALNLGDDGFNDKGCNLDGLSRTGELCDLADILRVFDPETGLDQFGLDEDGYNAFGCSLEGKRRDGTLCPADEVTRIFDAQGRDQFGYDKAMLDVLGLDKDKRNIHGCDLMGRKEDGSKCTQAETTRLFDGSDRDQFGASATYDPFEIIDGRNSFGCDLNGLREDGTLCPLSQITRRYNKDGYDQFGLRRNGRNAFGCNLEGKDEEGNLCPVEQIPRIYDINERDQFGLGVGQTNESGCGLSGFKTNGERCSLSEIPRIFGDDKRDQFGLTIDGFNDKGCGLDGLNRLGQPCAFEDITRIIDSLTGLDQFGLDDEGFNAKGCSLKGLRRDGSVCPVGDIPRIFGKDGRDQLGLDGKGFNEKNCSIYGLKPDGTKCPTSDITRILDADGKDQFGIGVDGFTEQGCDINNNDRFGNKCHPKFAIKFKDSKGVDQFGMVNGVNKNGCDINGIHAETGKPCKLEDITRVYSIGGDEDVDQLGLKRDGFTPEGCGLDGKRADGTLCDPEDIPRIVNDKGEDQFGLKDGLNDKGCSLLGIKADGTPCDVEDVTMIFGDDGFSHMSLDSNLQDSEGYFASGFDVDGCDRENKNAEGKYCSKFIAHDWDAADKIYIDNRVEEQLKLVDTLNPADPIGNGTYDYVKEEQEKAAAKLQALLARQAQIENEAPSQQTDEAPSAEISIEIPQGAALMVVVDSAVNSDYTDEVWGTIVGSELDGHRVKGTIEVPFIDNPVMPRDKFRYVFDTLVYNRKAYPIDAVSFDYSGTAGFVDGDDVDYHRLQRYGGLVAATVLQAMEATWLDSAAEQDAQAQKDVSEAAAEALRNQYNIGGNTTAYAKENMKVATQNVTDLAKEQFFRRPTITKGSTEILMIFRAEVDNDELPTVYTDLR